MLVLKSGRLSSCLFLFRVPRVCLLLLGIISVAGTFNATHNQLLGAVFQEKGQVTFVQNLIVLDLDYSPTKLMLNNLTVLLPKLDRILVDPNSHLHLEEKKIWGRIRSDIWQLVPMQSSRPNRSLLPFEGVC